MISPTRDCVIVSRHGLPAQSPLQPCRIAIPVGDCVSVTVVPEATIIVQVPVVVPSFTLQLIPAGLLVMVPLPRDAGDGPTVTFTGAGGAGGGVSTTGAVNPADTLLVALGAIVTAQVGPAQAPVNPLKLLLPLTAATSATAPPDGNEALHVPLATPALIVHAMPLGELVTLPLPVPKPVTASVPGGAGTRQVTSTRR